MKYTVRFAHLEKAPDYKVGDKIKEGDVIGIMGSTGKSTANHLHIDCVISEVKTPFKLADIGVKHKPSKKQLDFFIDDALFKFKPFITTQYLDPEYKKVFGKDHPAYDVVPEDRERWIGSVKKGSRDHFTIFWNRSKEGTVSLIVDDPAGYGHCVYIAFEGVI